MNLLGEPETPHDREPSFPGAVHEPDFDEPDIRRPRREELEIDGPEL
jgi:hypothetical protein